MVLFKRKNRQEDDDLLDKDPEERGRFTRNKNKDDKDLKSDKPQRRKEPKKPWGRKERILVLMLLVLTVGISAILSLSSRNWKLPGIPRFALPKFSLPFLGSKTIVIEGNRKDRIKSDKGSEFFKDETENLSGVYTLYLVRLGNGSNYGVNEKDAFQAASLIKLPVMAAMFTEVEEGRLSLSSKYKLKSSDKVKGSGSLYNKPPGYEITYENLIKLMGKESDNTAFNIGRKYLGDEKIAEVIGKIGMKNTSLEENSTTSEDIGVFFQELWNGNTLNNDHKEMLLEYLTDTIYENWLPSGIPEDIRVAHKFGRELHVVNDAGIVYANDPFVMVMLSEGIVEKEADSVIPEIVKGIYEIESSTDD